MPRATWPLLQGRPRIQVALPLPAGGGALIRDLLADTGAGKTRARFELILAESDCLLCGATPFSLVLLGGAYSGSFPVYLLRVQIPSLGFDSDLRAVGVATVPAGFAGIACFSFLNRFTYGNFGNPAEFGLET